MNKVGVVIASTGGNKLLRCVRSLRKMEPDLPIHAMIDRSAITYQMLYTPISEILKYADVNHVPAHGGFVNGGLNRAIDWMKFLEFDYACLLQDDLVFSPLPEHIGDLSEWFNHPLLAQSSGLRFSHF